MRVLEHLMKFRRGFRVNKVLEILDEGSKLFVSLTDEQRVTMFAVLTPEQMVMAMKLKELWEQFTNGEGS
jgi:hypothetical protein